MDQPASHGCTREKIEGKKDAKILIRSRNFIFSPRVFCQKSIGCARYLVFRIVWWQSVFFFKLSVIRWAIEAFYHVSVLLAVLSDQSITSGACFTIFFFIIFLVVDIFIHRNYYFLSMIKKMCSICLEEVNFGEIFRSRSYNR